MQKFTTIGALLAAGFTASAFGSNFPVLGTGSLESFADSNIGGDAPASSTTLGAGRTWNYRASGAVAGTSGIRFMTIQGAPGSFQSWGMIEFDPTEALAAIQAEVDSTAGATGFRVTGAQFVAQQQSSQPFSAVNGLIDLFHVTDDATNAALVTGSVFTNQFGGASLVTDNFAYSNIPSNNFVFENASTDDTSVLADWNEGTDLIRMVLAAADGSVVAPFKGSSSPFGGINAPSFRLSYEILGAKGAIPTPGAVSLFALAGLAGARRRRA